MPGLADTRGIQQDGIHKWSIATQIKKHIDSVTAVLVVTTGAASGVTVGTDYAFSTLSIIIPKLLGSSIGLMFTNGSRSLQRNLSGDTIPGVLKEPRQFHLNNPIVHQKEYLKANDGPERADLRKAVKASNQSTLGMPVDLFDWLDGLRPQPVNEIASLHEQSRAIETKVLSVHARQRQAAVIRAEIEEQKWRLQECRLVSFDFVYTPRLLDEGLGHFLQHHGRSNPQTKTSTSAASPGVISTCNACPG